MSKPHVWVVEQNEGDGWTPEYLGCDKEDAKHQRDLMARVFGHSDEFRVAKYVRVEPTAKRRKRK